MPHILTRRNVSAVAKLDMSGLGHAQRLEAIAKALGYETAASLMSLLKASEAQPGATSAPSDQVHVVMAFGETLTSRVDSDEPLRDEHGDMDGDIVEHVFATPAEAKAYHQGIGDADGWMAMTCVLDSSDEPQHAYLEALKHRPDLSFEAFYTAAQSARDAFYEDDEDIIGYQVENPETGEHYGDRPSFVVIDQETASAEMDAALAKGETQWRVLVIREGTIEEPTFE